MARDNLGYYFFFFRDSVSKQLKLSAFFETVFENGFVIIVGFLLLLLLLFFFCFFFETVFEKSSIRFFGDCV